MATVAKVLGTLWIIAAGLVIAACTIMIGVKEGFGAVRDLFSPFNILNYFAIAVAMAPGLGLLVISEKLAARAKNGKTGRQHGSLES